MKIHTLHFLVLVIIVVTGMYLFFYAQGNRSLQLTIGITSALAYVAWGLIHHAIQRDLYPKVVVEYVLMGLIAIVLLMTIFGP